MLFGLSSHLLEQLPLEKREKRASASRWHSRTQSIKHQGLQEQERQFCLAVPLARFSTLQEVWFGLGWSSPLSRSQTAGTNTASPSF